jgi:hypothetical protein
MQRSHAIVRTRESVWQWCGLLHTSGVTLITDHQPFKWLMEFDKLTRKLAQWVLISQEYDFQVVHTPKVANLDADGFSWNPCTSQRG